MNTKHILSAAGAAAVLCAIATFGSVSLADCKGPVVSFFASGGSGCNAPSSGVAFGSNGPFGAHTINVSLNFLAAGDTRARGRGFDAAGSVRCSLSDFAADGAVVQTGCPSTTVNLQGETF
jgi:hypothetical protein